jgi:hypothetical protein
VSVLHRFRSLYDGLDRVHGKYEIDKDLSSRQKKVTGKAVTLKANVTEDLFQMHFAGEQGLGLVPIRDDQRCVFGALDIDEYPLDHENLVERISNAGMPLVVCTTKSGGAHCYLFLSEPVRADIVMDRLREFAEALGYPEIEIFPKQKTLKPQDVGNWINLPYFDVVNGEFDRYALDAMGKPIMDLEKFCDYAEHMRVTKDELLAVKVEKAKVPFIDGPPCLQRLAEHGFPEGARNSGLLNVGVYCRKKFHDDWQERLGEMNHVHMKPPLPPQEVASLAKSLDRKDYGYTCDQAPINAVCGRDACLGRQYGIGGGDGGAELEQMLGGLQKSVSYNLQGEEIQDHKVIWFMTVDGTQIQLTTRQLFNQDQFREKCAERLRKLPPKVRPQRWDAILRDRIENAELVVFDSETGVYGHVVKALKEFVVRRGDSENRSDILAGKVWSDGKGYIWFRNEAFWDFLLKKGIYRPRDDAKEVHIILRNVGGEKKQLMIDSKKNVNKLCWRMVEFEGGDESPEPKGADTPF